MVLSYIVFSLPFPGPSKLSVRFVDVPRNGVAGRTILATLVPLLGYTNGSLGTFSFLLNMLLLSRLRFQLCMGSR